jgi:integrase
MALSNKLTKTDIQAALRRRTDRARVLSDGAGLYLRIRPGSAVASWFFASNAGGRRRELGLGSASAVSITTARKLAGEARDALAQGRDPFAEKAASKRQGKEAKRVPRFGEFAEDYADSVESGWRNAKHRQSWRTSLSTHGASLSKIPVDEVTTDDVLKVLRPIWTAKPETASRVRGRIEKVLAAAKAQGLRPRDSSNPAAWRNHLDLLLPKRRTLARGHHKALPFADVPAFMAKLRARPALAARALEFTILTAARTGETLGARWQEFDWSTSTWIVPGHRMKAGTEHRVPLSRAALDLLGTLKPKEPQPEAFVFCEQRRPLSNMALLALLRRMKVDATTHGFRSCFRDWCGETTDFPSELAEWALAHQVGGAVERSYRRQTAVERRRPLMEAWSAYVSDRGAAGLAAPANDDVPAEPTADAAARGVLTD